jgi:tRNA-dihydrouridine synthase
MGNPWIFKQARQLARGEAACIPSVQERLEIMGRHLDLYKESLAGRQSLTGIRSRLMWYSKGLRGSARLRAALGACRDSETMIKVCEDFFANLEKESSIREER